MKGHPFDWELHAATFVIGVAVGILLWNAVFDYRCL